MLALDVGSKSFVPLEKAGNYSLPTVRCCTEGGIYGKSVSAFPTCFSVGIFPFAQSVGATSPISGFLLEGIFPCVAVDSVCLWEEMRSGDSYVPTLDLKTHFALS